MTARNTRKENGSGVLTKASAGGRRSGSKQPPSVIIENGCFAGLRIALKKQRTSFGRNISCDICLDHSFVSDEHAAIVRSGGNYYLEDLGSRYGTSVNGKETHKQNLKNGDRIGIGEFELKFCC